MRGKQSKPEKAKQKEQLAPDTHMGEDEGVEKIQEQEQNPNYIRFDDYGDGYYDDTINFVVLINQGDQLFGEKEMRPQEAKQKKMEELEVAKVESLRMAKEGRKKAQAKRQTKAR